MNSKNILIILTLAISSAISAMNPDSTKFSAFIDAVKKSDIKKMEELYAESPEIINSGPISGLPPLFVAINTAAQVKSNKQELQKKIGVIKWLISKGANVCSLCENDYTTLHAAIDTKNAEIFTILLEAGATKIINVPFRTGTTLTTPLGALLGASIKVSGLDDIIELLLSYGAGDEQTLFLAQHCFPKFSEKIKQNLKKRSKKRIDDLKKPTSTCTQQSVQPEQKKTAAQKITTQPTRPKTSQLDIAKSACGKTPAEKAKILRFLASGSDIAAVQYLLEHGNIETIRLRGALDEAQNKDNKEMIALIKDAISKRDFLVPQLEKILAGLDASITNEYRCAPTLHDALIWAAYDNHVDIITRLHEAGVPINYQSRDNGDTALIAAAREGHMEAVKTILPWCKTTAMIRQRNYAWQNANDVCNNPEIASLIAERIISINLDKVNIENYGSTKMPERSCIEAAARSDIATLEEFYKQDPSLLYCVAHVADPVEKRTQQVKIGASNPFGHALLAGNAQTVEWFLDHGARVEDHEILAACRSNSVEKLKVLLNHGSTKAWIDSTIEGRSILIRATQDGRTAIVQCLLEHGADPNVKDTSGMIALDHAIIQYTQKPEQEEFIEIARKLLDAGTTNSGKTLILVIHAPEDMFQLIRTHVKPIDQAVERGDTKSPEPLAETNGTEKAMLIKKMLTDKLPVFEHLDKNPALREQWQFIEALGNKETSLATLQEMYLKNKNLIDATGYLPAEGIIVSSLTYALKHGTVQTVQWLLERGASFDAVKQFHPLVIACTTNDLEKVKLVLQHAQHLINEQLVPEQISALMMAIAKCNVDIVKELLQHDSDLNLTDCKGNTALDFALMQWNKNKEAQECASLLLAHGIQINGKTLDYARQAGEKAFSLVGRVIKARKKLEKIRSKQTDATSPHLETKQPAVASSSSQQPQEQTASTSIALSTSQQPDTLEDAIEQRNIEAVKRLLESGADIYETYSKNMNMNMLDLAKKYCAQAKRNKDKNPQAFQIAQSIRDELLAKHNSLENQKSHESKCAQQEMERLQQELLEQQKQVQPSVDRSKEESTALQKKQEPVKPAENGATTSNGHVDKERSDQAQTTSDQTHSKAKKRSKLSAQTKKAFALQLRLKQMQRAQQKKQILASKSVEKEIDELMQEDDQDGHTNTDLEPQEESLPETPVSWKPNVQAFDSLFEILRGSSKQSDNPAKDIAPAKKSKQLPQAASAPQPRLSYAALASALTNGTAAAPKEKATQPSDCHEEQFPPLPSNPGKGKKIDPKEEITSGDVTLPPSAQTKMDDGDRKEQYDAFFAQRIDNEGNILLEDCACLDEALACTQELLRRQALLNNHHDPQETYRTVLQVWLYQAIERNNLQEVQQCIQAGVHVNHRSLFEPHETPLTAATRVGNPSIMKALMQAGAKLELSNTDSTKPGQYALNHIWVHHNYYPMEALLYSEKSLAPFIPIHESYQSMIQRLQHEVNYLRSLHSQQQSSQPGQ